MYKCESCNVEYKSRMGFYKHNKKYHPEKINKGPNLICVYCKKEFKHYTNKWTHEQKCKFKDLCIQTKEKTDEFNLMKSEIEMLKKKIETLESKPVTNITNNTTNNTTNNNTSNTINNITVVIPFGKEPLNCIPESEIIKTLEECGINAITVLCKKKHFNPDLPHLHNFCVTAKNDPYAIIIDPETKRTKSVNKKEVFDKAYYGVVMNIDSVKTQKPEIEETKDKIRAISMSKPMIKHVRTAINEEAYHNKDMIQKTWENATFEVNYLNKNQNNILSKPKTRDELIKEFDKLLTDVKNSFEIDV